MLVLIKMHEIHRHMDTEELERYSIGRVSEEEAARVEEHLLVCESCRQSLDEIDAYVTAMSRATTESLQPEFMPRWSLVPLLAAVACLVVLLSFAVRWPGSQRPPPAVTLVATRSNGSDASFPAGRPLSLRPDLTGLAPSPSYRVEMVDDIGRHIWSGKLTPPQDSVTVPPQSAGTYFVRIYSASGELLREYGLQIKKK